jgi:hypothetical protein
MQLAIQPAMAAFAAAIIVAAAGAAGAPASAATVDRHHARTKVAHWEHRAWPRHWVLSPAPVLVPDGLIGPYACAGYYAPANYGYGYGFPAYGYRYVGPTCPVRRLDLW